MGGQYVMARVKVCPFGMHEVGGLGIKWKFVMVGMRFWRNATVDP